MINAPSWSLVRSVILPAAIQYQKPLHSMRIHHKIVNHNDQTAIQHQSTQATYSDRGDLGTHKDHGGRC